MVRTWLEARHAGVIACASITVSVAIPILVVFDELHLLSIERGSAIRVAARVTTFLLIR